MQNIRCSLIGIEFSFAETGRRITGVQNFGRTCCDHLKGIDRPVLGAHHCQVLNAPLLQLLHRIFCGLKRVLRRGLRFDSRMRYRSRGEHVDRQLPNDLTQQDIANSQCVRPTNVLVCAQGR